ncbi:MAG: hypothetical protein ACREOM_07515 [Candidatus Dormibacteraceae bacterium]
MTSPEFPHPHRKGSQVDRAGRCDPRPRRPLRHEDAIARLAAEDLVCVAFLAINWLYASQPSVRPFLVAGVAPVLAVVAAAIIGLFDYVPRPF